MFDLFDTYAAPALWHQFGHADLVRNEGGEAALSAGSATTNAYGGGWTAERIPQEE
ncbi:MAG: hypothetical protein ACOVMT_10045 [Caulobacter sp.]